MNRRSFFKSLSAAVAGTVVLPPAITFDRCWKYPYKESASGILVPNPEWFEAPFEIAFIEFPGVWMATDSKPLRFGEKQYCPTIVPSGNNDKPRIREAYPIRFKNLEDAKNFRSVNPFLFMKKPV